eukprot:TRINITY_DN42_c0_g1_i1.p2 TRINITY_DN42_c0_g1~~TRINITY_DN42_c0_g1_i1.p2  ORF type:complete len:112 (+),score=21.82 TRINITY_DN42_c0_g1_i1:581-916(+)
MIEILFAFPIHGKFEPFLQKLLSLLENLVVNKISFFFWFNFVVGKSSLFSFLHSSKKILKFKSKSETMNNFLKKSEWDMFHSFKNKIIPQKSFHVVFSCNFQRLLFSVTFF